MINDVASQTLDEKLSQLFIKMFGIKDCFERDIDLRDEYLMGYKVGMAPRDLLCLFFAIEKEFEIRIPQDAIINNKFDTYNKILSVITELKKDDLTTACTKSQ